MHVCDPACRWKNVPSFPSSLQRFHHVPLFAKLTCSLVAYDLFGSVALFQPPGRPSSVAFPPTVNKPSFIFQILSYRQR